MFLLLPLSFAFCASFCISLAGCAAKVDSIKGMLSDERCGCSGSRPLPWEEGGMGCTDSFDTTSRVQVGYCCASCLLVLVAPAAAW